MQTGLQTTTGVLLPDLDWTLDDPVTPADAGELAPAHRGLWLRELAALPVLDETTEIISEISQTASLP
jgi:hypothetical protein